MRRGFTNEIGGTRYSSEAVSPFYNKKSKKQNRLTGYTNILFVGNITDKTFFFTFSTGANLRYERQPAKIRAPELRSNDPEV